MSLLIITLKTRKAKQQHLIQASYQRSVEYLAREKNRARWGQPEGLWHLNKSEPNLNTFFPISSPKDSKLSFVQIFSFFLFCLTSHEASVISWYSWTIVFWLVKRTHVVLHLWLHGWEVTYFITPLGVVPFKIGGKGGIHINRNALLLCIMWLKIVSCQ